MVDITIKDAELLRLIIHGPVAFELLRTGLEMDLFQAVEAAGGLSVDQAAATLGIERQPARILLLGLCSLDVLRKEGDRYVNSDIARRKLLRDSPEYLGPLVDIQAKIINPAMGDYAEATRRFTNVGLRHLSGPGTTLYERLTAHPELQQVFYDNMGDASRKAFAQVLDNFDFTGRKHLVDVGGGDGSNAIELAKRYPDLEVTVFDQERVISIAAERAAEADLAKRVHTYPGDMLHDPLPEGIDGVLFFHIFEIWSLERNTELLRKCYDALPEGGVCLVYNYVSNDEGTGSLMAGMMSPYFITLASGEGMVYSPGDVEQAIRAAGFRRAERYDRMKFSHALVVGYK
ncbi:acetylserotonin O-methyltransferase [Saccharothrix australiensis]|uniref:Methyltransferase family protein n=1 Tax=Saccharothrix australiensis TaxID=2072 RepID=A0A495VYJ0_9PSEU|nr:acetylserotonin O-methyltransferase [Saccharothrix australiensis]RKT54274.1 methyltransferase family protein [Saccharothrix australiensis]